MKSKKTSANALELILLKDQKPMLADGLNVAFSKRNSWLRINSGMIISNKSIGAEK